MTRSSYAYQQTRTTNGSDTTFAFSFPFTSKTHVKVYRVTTATEAMVELTQNTDFTVSAPSESGGTITYPISGSAVAAGYTLYIRRETPAYQSTDYTDGASFSAAQSEGALDNIVEPMQEIVQQWLLSRGGYSSNIMSRPIGATTWYANSLRITDVADAEDGTDAVNYDQVLEMIAGVTGDDSGAQLRVDLASTADDKGAELVGIRDAGGYFSGTNVEAALQQLGAAGAGDHGSLTGLADDDHTQYMHNSNARTVSANHIFSGSPEFTGTTKTFNGGTMVIDDDAYFSEGVGAGKPYLYDAASGNPYLMGYMAAPLNTQNANYTLVLGDRGKTILKTNTTAYAWTIPPNASVAYDTGTTVVLINAGSSGAVTVTQGAGVTLQWAGTTTTGNRTLGAGGVATIIKTATNTWFISGAGIT